MHRNLKTMLAVFSMTLAFTSVATGQVLVDPTRPFDAAPSTSARGEIADTLILSAIFINGDHKHAIINGMNVKEGQDVAGKTLISISKGRVILRGAKGSQELYVNHSQFIKDANDGF